MSEDHNTTDLAELLLGTGIAPSPDLSIDEQIEDFDQHLTHTRSGSPTEPTQEPTASYSVVTPETPLDVSEGILVDPASVGGVITETTTVGTQLGENEFSDETTVGTQSKHISPLPPTINVNFWENGQISDPVEISIEKEKKVENEFSDEFSIDDLIRDHALGKIAEDQWQVELHEDTEQALKTLQEGGVNLQNDLKTDRNGTLRIDPRTPDVSYQVIDRETCLVMDDDFFLTNQLYRVPLVFDPHTLLSGIEDFDLGAMRDRIDPDQKDSAFWKKELKKLKGHRPEEWLEGQLLKTLLHVLNVIIGQIHNHHNEASLVGKQVNYHSLFHFTKIGHKKFKKACPKVKGNTLYYHAVMILAGFGVVKLNKKYCTGEGDTTAFPKSFKMGSGYMQPLWKLISTRRPIRRRAVPNLEAGTIEHFIQVNLLRLKVEPDRIRRLFVETTDPNRVFQLVEAWRNLLTNPYVTRGKKSGRVYHPLTNSPTEFRSVVTLDDGQSLYDVDIAQAQAILLWTYLKENGIAPLEVEDLGRMINDPDIDIYKNLNGGTKELTGKDRKNAKKQFYTFIFSGKGRSKIVDSMQDRFPMISEYISDVAYARKQHEKAVTEARDARQEIPPTPDGLVSLAAELQAMESDIVIDGLVADCMERGIHIVPIHDGWMCLEADRQFTRESAIRHFKARTGVEPRFKTELLTA